MLLLFWVLPAPCFAHAAERGFVLLLPTGYYLFGGTAAVAASLLIVSLIRDQSIRRLTQHRDLMRWSDRPAVVVSLASTMLLFVLIMIGWLGDSDPLTNLLPLVVWTFFWVALTLLHALFGNWWRWLNPWTGLVAILNHCGFSLGSTAILQLPARLGFLPAIIVFLGFAWFELVSLSPEDPVHLATVVATYWLFTLIAIAVFGERDWLARGEAFSVFFRFISRLSPFCVDTDSDRSPPGDQLRLTVALPGAQLIRKSDIGWSGAAFILITLATVSFDGLNKTFWWLHLNGINPLAFSGRSSVTTINTLGLLGACLVLVLLYLGAVTLGWAQQRSPDPQYNAVSLSTVVGSYALAIMPISLAYHAAHFLTQLLVNGQYLLKNLSDPLGQGLDLFGTANWQVTTSFLSHHHAVERLWQFQVLAIVLGHVVSVLITHGIALRLYQSHRAAVRSQWPLGLLMVAYTLFGLWLLSTPTGL